MTSSASAGPLLLVVEDDFLIAFDLSCRLSDLGYRVLGPANSVRGAHALLAKAAPDAAILDVNLNGEAVTPVAQRLQSRGIPYLLLTAYSPSEDDPPALSDAPRLNKPAPDHAIAKLLDRLIC